MHTRDPAIAADAVKTVFPALPGGGRDHVRRVREISRQLKGEPGGPGVGTAVARSSVSVPEKRVDVG